MADERSSNPRLIAFLKSLVEHDDRKTLAHLRASLRPGQELKALPFVLPYLLLAASAERAPVNDRARRCNEDDAVLLAGLFALHPASGSDSLAKALAQVHRDTGSDSVEGRFRALLSSSRAELGTHLRHAVSLVASKGHAIDWHDLARALAFWDGTEQGARRQWARDFWAAAPELTPAVAAAAPPATSAPAD